ncbi:MAG: PilN domain-containing protein [Myxococcota bacterium]|jgi:type IV pilus assembly protein PilN|nr:PilN domain-containing protein [Myxococcota bacterium]
MIRINLLPVRRDRKKEAVRNQFLVALLVLLVEASVCALFYNAAASKAAAQGNQNQLKVAEVEKLKKEVADHKEILDKITEYEKRQTAIDMLFAGRTGPTHVMLEMSRLLSKGGRPFVDPDKYQELLRFDASAGYDEDWDYRRLWLDRFVEKDHLATIEGQAVTHEDVAEFLRRVNLSQFFTETQLVSTELKPPTVKSSTFSVQDADPVVHFKFDTEMRYR